jgi:hypothetical protein
MIFPFDFTLLHINIFFLLKYNLKLILMVMGVSDDAEKYDSDGDAPSSRKHHSNRNSGKEYRDSESLGSPERPVTGSGSNGTGRNTGKTPRTSTPRNIKPVDLGAAADFAKQASKSEKVIQWYFVN